jgi:probable methyltransferase, YaeB/AF_0241 family
VTDAASNGAEEDETITYRAIGTLHSPHGSTTGMPIQPTGARGINGHITIFPEFAAGLKDLDGFSHVIILYHLHRVHGHDLLVKPFLDTQTHGIFSTRSPKRPNPIGLSVLELRGVQGARVLLSNVDILDGTPVLDIKPYVPGFDVWPAERTGWFEGKVENATTCKADDRFA